MAGQATFELIRLSGLAGALSRAPAAALEFRRPQGRQHPVPPCHRERGNLCAFLVRKAANIAIELVGRREGSARDA